MANGQPQPQLPAQIPTPPWLGPIITLTTQVGVPTVVAGVLLWFVLVKVDGTLKLIQDEEENRTKIVSAMQDTMIAALDRLGQRFEKAIDDNIKANRDIADRYDPPRPRRPEAE